MLLLQGIAIAIVLLLYYVLGIATCFWKPLRPQFLRGSYRVGGTGDVINHASGSLSGHSSLEDLIDWGAQETQDGLGCSPV